ncbi:MAG: polysaccharide biosynthesis tyrosine autokinase [Actinomycetota bacterium]|nr:polysaccharide biosynthesis tyrosine autokinase [Actinomycetota bacterium]
MTSDVPTPQPFHLREYLAVLRGRRWTVIATTAITLFAAMFFSLRMTPQYSSTARVLVKPLTGSSQLLDPVPLNTLSLDTEREIVKSTAVAELAGNAMDTPLAPQELVRHLSVSVPSQTQILQITYTDPSPLTAQRGAQAFADSYITFKRNQALDTYTTVANSLQHQIDGLQVQLNHASTTSDNSSPGSAAKRGADDRISLLSSRIALLTNQISSLTTQDINPGAVIQAAVLPTAPSSPNHILNGGIGLFVGLALGIGLAFLRERLDDRLKGREDLEEHIAAPTLVVIPKVPDWRNKSRAKLVTLEDPRGAPAEAYKMLRTSILFICAQNDLRSLMVASAAASEGKTTTAANLATVLAQAGKRVILVSADLRKPRIGKFFDPTGRHTAGQSGLTAVLTGSTTVQEALEPTGVDGLWLLDSGPIPANPAEMAQSQAMATLLEALRDSADFTIIDSAPALVVTDALAMAPHVDGILFVADAGKTTRQTVLRARTQLEHVGGRIIGSVLNGFDPSKASSYSYEYGSRYTYRYRYEDESDKRAARR